MTRPKNILFLFTDQQRRDTLGCYGNRICRTPHIDGLAAGGIRFERAYTCSAICTPARASLITGVWPHQHCLVANFERNVAYPTELSDHHATFADVLRKRDYRVRNVGKWHVGVERGPEAHGFEGVYYPGWCAPVQHPDYARYLRENGYPPVAIRDPIRGIFPNAEPGNIIGGYVDIPKEATFPYFLAERTIAWLETFAGRYRDEGKPFYLSTHFFGPHLPYFLPESIARMYDPEDVVLPGNLEAETFAGKPGVQRNYAAHWGVDTLSGDTLKRLTAMYWAYCSLIDEQIGRIVEKLDALGLRGDTAVFFSSDHGGFVGSHRMMDKGPAMYEEIYRIPLVLSAPGTVPEGQVTQELVNLMDFPCTFLDLAGAGIPEHYVGRSLLPLARGERPADWPDVTYAQFHGHHFPYPQRMIVSKRYKLIVNPADICELYDLQNDPLELRNEFENPALAEIRDALMGRLFRYLEATGDNFRHWMATMYRVGADADNAAQSPFQQSPA